MRSLSKGILRDPADSQIPHDFQPDVEDVLEKLNHRFSVDVVGFCCLFVLLCFDLQS